jgi:molybdopterin/thiamine biosynthesis adenylyltransferase
MAEGSVASAFPERYARHRGLSGFSPAVQEGLAGAAVLVAGVGGLGGLAAFELAAAGVGRLVLCDPGLVEESNLNRQLFYRLADLDQPKANLLAERLSAFAPGGTFQARAEALTSVNAAELVDGVDLILDCFDNDESRFVLNRAAVDAGLPLVHGGIRGWNGEAAILNVSQAPCFACLRHPGAPKPSAPIPVIACSAAQIATMQVHLAVRHLTGIGEDGGSLWIWDGGDMAMRRLSVKKNPRCTVCG